MVREFVNYIYGHYFLTKRSYDRHLARLQLEEREVLMSDIDDISISGEFEDIDANIFGQSDREESDGEETDGEETDGEETDGEETDGEETDGEETDKETDREETDGETDGEESDGEERDEEGILPDVLQGN